MTTEYVYDLGGAVVAEFVGTTWTKGYVYMGGLLAQYSNGTTYFVHKDHLGSTRALSNVSGGLHEAYDFLPYGEPVGANKAKSTIREMAKTATGRTEAGQNPDGGEIGRLAARAALLYLLCTVRKWRNWQTRRT